MQHDELESYKSHDKGKSKPIKSIRQQDKHKLP